jgi:hypothetical protein
MLLEDDDDTVRLKVAIFVTLPPVALTVIGKVPAGDAEEVAMFKSREQVGLQVLEET